MNFIRRKSSATGKERGFAGLGIAGLMLGFGVLYFVSYFILDWIYETKEERKIGHSKQIEELRVITKEEVMKRGVGQHIFKCSGIFWRTCKPIELYKDTVKSEEFFRPPLTTHQLKGHQQQNHPAQADSRQR